MLDGIGNEFIEAAHPILSRMQCWMISRVSEAFLDWNKKIEGKMFPFDYELQLSSENILDSVSGRGSLKKVQQTKSTDIL